MDLDIHHLRFLKFDTRKIADMLSGLGSTNLLDSFFNDRGKFRRHAQDILIDIPF